MKIIKKQVYFDNIQEFLLYFNRLQGDNLGSSGSVKRWNNKNVIKYLNGAYGDKYKKLSEEEILKFKNVKVDSYIFANRVFYIENILSGYFCKYCSGLKLDNVNKDRLSFNKLINGGSIFQKDTQEISNLGIQTIDLFYNLLYKNGMFFAIDTIDYKQTDTESSKLYVETMKVFNGVVIELLVKDRFSKFVKDSSELSNLMREIKNGEDIVLFLKLLKDKLSEYCGFEVKTVIDAKPAINITNKSDFQYIKVYDEDEYNENSMENLDDYKKRLFKSYSQNNNY